MKRNNQTNINDTWIRRNLTLVITLVSLFGVIILTGVSIYFIFHEMLPRLNGTPQNGNPKDAFSMLQTVFGVVLPLIGTWMGTILAFYFSKENFEAASKSASDLYNNVANNSTSINNKYESKNAYEESRKFEDIEYNTSLNNKKDSEISIITDIYNFINTNSKGDRLPIFNSEKIIRYVIHLSTVNDFLTQFSNKKFPDLVDKPKAELTLADMSNKSNNLISDKIQKSFGFVSKSSTLSEVQILMKNDVLCQDVFVTADGKKDQPILGWITNNKLNDLSKA